MKKILFLLAIVITSTATAQPFKIRPYQTGIFIFCGKELPKKFSYLIEKKSLTTDSWTAVAEVRAPQNEAACKAALLDLPVVIASKTKIEDGTISIFWKLVEKSTVLDSLFAFAMDPRYQSAAGCGWFDDGIKIPGTYQYRISKIARNGEKTPAGESKVDFPGNPYNGTIEAVRYRINESNVSISYKISDSLNTAGVKVYRSLYKAGNFSEVSADVLFTKEDNKMVALIRDGSVLKNVTYSYIAQPYDVLGNPGKATTDTLNIYNFTKAADIGIVESFDATQVPEKKGIELKWKLQNVLNVTSVDVFRSVSYDGRYAKIASLPADANTYFDSYQLQPAKAYYYYLQINNGYGYSLPSARIPSILKGTRLNFLPPQNLTASRNENKVTLTFQRLGADTRGYYVYRASGYTGPLVQLPRMLLSTDTLLSYNDTLPMSSLPNVYTYAVASVNSSYNISPLTERVSVTYSGGMLPVPSAVNALWYNHKVFVTWNNVSEQNAAISAYRIYRSVVDNDNAEKDMKLVATTSFEENSYADSLVAAGVHYRYRIECVASDSADLSSLSMAAGIVIPSQLPLQPGSVSAYAADGKIVISWDLPEDKSIAAVRIYRATAGNDAQLLKELPVTATQFEDVNAKPGQVFFYYIKTVNGEGAESEPTDAVSAKLK